MTRYGKKRKKSGLPVKEQDAKVSVPVVETQARIDDRERRPPLLTKRWRERERGGGEREKSDIPVDIFAAQAMKVPIQVFETVKRAKIRVEKRRVV